MRWMRNSVAVCLMLVGLVASVGAQPAATGSLAAATNTVVFDMAGAPSAIVQITGTWTGTITFEATVGTAGNWTSLVVTRQSTYALGSTTTANDTYVVANPGYSQIRVRMSSYTSGTAVIAIQSGLAAAPLPAQLAGTTTNLWTRTSTTLAPTTAGDTLGTVLFTGEVLAREAFTQPLAVFEQDFTAKVLTDGGTMYVLGSPSGLITYREEQNKTASSWVVASNKLDITADNTTDNEGVEIYLGDGLLTDASGWILTGTTGGCFEVNFTVALIAGTDQFVIGWRKAEAFRDDNVYTGYADWSVVGINNVDGSIFSLGEVAGGGTLSDDSGVNAANGETHTLKSCIAATTRLATAFLDDNAITMTNSGVAKTAATVMNPFISYLQAGGAVDANIRINWWQITR